MLRHLFFIPLTLLLTACCLLHAVVCAEQNVEQSNNSITLFSVNLPDEKTVDAPDSTLIAYENIPGIGETSGGKEKKATNFYSSFIFTTDGAMVAATTMIYGEENMHTSKIVERDIYIETYKNDWGMEVVKDNKSWSSEVFISNNNNPEDQKQDGRGVVAVKRNKHFQPFLAVGKEKKIYLLSISYDDTNVHAGFDFKNINWSFELFVGDVKPEKQQATQQSKTIEWKKNDDASNKITEEFKKTFPDILPYLTSAAFLTDDGKIVFVVELRVSEISKRAFPVFIQLTVRSEEIQWELSNAENTDDGDSLYFFPWKRKFVTFTKGKNGNKGGAYETADMGKQWQKVERSAFSVLRFLERFDAYKSVTINNKSAVLFTKKIIERLPTKGSYRSYLWVTDGSRAHNLGLLAQDDKYIEPQSLLYTNGELFALLEAWEEKDKTKELILTRSKELVGKTAAVLDTWANVSDVVLRLCNQMIDQPSDICNMQSFTDGLVGFLFNASDVNSKQWKDEYLYANATVSNGTKVNNGFKFDKAGAGAKWPVGKQEEQPYNFTDPGFTLVATVTVDNVSYEKDNSVLGVDYREEFFVGKRLGLWCTKEGKWRVKSEKKLFYPESAEISLETVINGDMCEQGKTYMVALLLNDGKFSVHVNGEKGGRTSQDIFINRTTAEITQFYFGAVNLQNDDDFNVSPPPRTTQKHNAQQNDEESHVTVRNVLLYNRPFSDGEIKKFKLKHDEISQSFGDDGKSWTMSGNGSSSHGSGGAVNNTLILNGGTNGDEKKQSVPVNGDSLHRLEGAVNNTLISQESTNKEIVLYISVLSSLLLSVFASALI